MSIAEKFEVIADAVYAKGKQDEQSDFWDIYQKKGAQVSNYTYAFAYTHWTDDIYNPKYKFRVTYSTNSMFYNSNITDTKVEFDLSYCTLANGMFWNSKIKTIRKLIVHEALNLNDTFKGCKDLEYIRFGGVIGQNISFSDSPLLTVESILNVFEHLKDISATNTTLTVSLGSTNLAKLTDTQKAIATEKGWTLA